MAHGETPLAQGGLDGFREAKEAGALATAAGLPDLPGNVVLGEPESGREFLVPEGLLHRIEVLPLEILNEGPVQGPRRRWRHVRAPALSVRPAIWAARQRRSPAINSDGHHRPDQ